MNWFVLGNAKYEFSFFGIQYEYDAAEAFCIGMGGKLIEPRDNGTITNVTNHAKTLGITMFWLGIHDKNEDGSFVYASDNLALNWNSWAPGEPGNSSIGENCVQVTDNGNWSSVPCQKNERSLICMRGKVVIL